LAASESNYLINKKLHQTRTKFSYILLMLIQKERTYILMLRIILLLCQ